MKELTKIFKSIADDTRLRIFNLLLITAREFHGGFLSEVLQKPHYAISKHINMLVRSGLISARREGQKVNFSISPKTKKIRIEMLKLLDSLCVDADIFTHDIERLKELEEIR